MCAHTQIWHAESRVGLSLFRRGRVGPDTAPLTNKEQNMSEEKKESMLVGCATIAILAGIVSAVAANLWLTWRICRAVEAILAK